MQERTDHGKWSDPGVPHRGWSCVDVIDHGEPAVTCEMCETAVIRYAHCMEHADYPEGLEVGCVCAEHMEEDYVRPRQREQALRQRAKRRQTWGTRAWHTSRKGNAYLKTDGYVLAIYPKEGGWGICVTAAASGAAPTYGVRVYPTLREAQLGAFAALEWAKAL